MSDLTINLPTNSKAECPQISSEAYRQLRCLHFAITAYLLFPTMHLKKCLNLGLFLCSTCIKTPSSFVWYTVIPSTQEADAGGSIWVLQIAFQAYTEFWFLNLCSLTMVTYLAPLNPFEVSYFSVDIPKISDITGLPYSTPFMQRWGGTQGFLHPKLKWDYFYSQWHSNLPV